MLHCQKKLTVRDEDDFSAVDEHVEIDFGKKRKKNLEEGFDIFELMWGRGVFLKCAPFVARSDDVPQFVCQIILSWRKQGGV